FRPARKRYRPRSASVQRKQSHKRHRSWQAEARVVLKQLQAETISHDEVGQVFQAMSPYAFEYLITECLKGQGNQIRKLRRVSGDGGIDGMVMLNKRWHIIQAKRYANPVSAGIVQEFLQLCI